MEILNFRKKNTPDAPRTAIFTRMAYSERIEPQRLDLFREIFLKSLKNQICRDFDVYVITGGTWGQESTAENIRLIKEQDASGLNIFYKHLNEIPRNKYNMQIRADCDDYLSPEFVLKCLDIYENTHKNCFVISFRPYRYDYINGKIYKKPAGKTIRKSPTMFSALCQKNEIKHFIHDYRHTGLKKITRNIIFVEEGFCMLTIHGKNKLSKIGDTERYLCGGKL